MEERPQTLANLVRGIANSKALADVKADPRKDLWELAQSKARTPEQIRAFMGVLSWLFYKRGVTDLVVLNRVASLIGSARNPYPYFQPGGRALESLLGSAAVQRAETEHEREKRANQDFLGTER